MDVKTLCLATLSLGDATGYDIKKQFEEGPFSHFYQASFGSIYPALGTLLEKGLVACREEEQVGRPDKKIYSLTDAGMGAFKKALQKKPSADKIRSESLVMFFFAHYMDDEDLRDVYDNYLNCFRQKLEFIESLEPESLPDGRLFVRGLGTASCRAMITYMEENRDQLFGGKVTEQTDCQ